MESSITTPAATAPETGASTALDKTPEQIAAEAALARASTPPTSVGGPGVTPQPGAPVLDQQPAEPEPERDGFAARLAADRREGDHILSVEDDYAEARDNVLAGSKDEDDVQAVTEWLLSDNAEVNSRKLTVVAGGSDEKPIIVDWYITAINIDVIRSAEREASGAGQGRGARRGQPQYDELAANLRIVAESTWSIVAKGAPSDPNQSIKNLAKSRGLRDPTTWLQMKFRHKPGLIAQVAGEVMALSGFDKDDVRAAGN